MISYGGRTLKIKTNSLSITTTNSQIVRHYPFTDRSISHDLGRSATAISCEIIAHSGEEKSRIERLLQTVVPRVLVLGDITYKDVVPDTSATHDPVALLSDDKWFITARFMALDPVPYDTDTGGALY